MSVELEHVDDAAAALLTGQRFTVAQTATSLPKASGLYAVYAAEAPRRELGLPDLDGQGHPIYVGKSESSLRVRDWRLILSSGRPASRRCGARSQR